MGVEVAGSKEKSFLISNSRLEGGQRGAGLGSCALPGFSLGGPPVGGQVTMVLREEGTRREVLRDTVLGEDSGFEEGI